MSQYQTLKTQIQQNIKQNGEGAIRGDILQTQLLDMINALGTGYQFMGVATPTNPGSAQTPDYKCFYLATTPGTYTNLGGLVVADGEVAILKWDSSWHKDATGIASHEKLTELASSIDNIVNEPYSLTWQQGNISGGVEVDSDYRIRTTSFNVHRGESLDIINHDSRYKFMVLFWNNNSWESFSAYITKSEYTSGVLNKDMQFRVLVAGVTERTITPDVGNKILSLVNAQSSIIYKQDLIDNNESLTNELILESGGIDATGADGTNVTRVRTKNYIYNKSFVTAPLGYIIYAVFYYNKSTLAFVERQMVNARSCVVYKENCIARVVYSASNQTDNITPKDIQSSCDLNYLDAKIITNETIFGVEEGAIDGGTGLDADNSARLRTIGYNYGYRKVKLPKGFIIYCIYYYDKTLDNFVSYQGVYVDEAIIGSDTYKWRITISKSPEASVTVEDFRIAMGNPMTDIVSNMATEKEPLVKFSYEHKLKDVSSILTPFDFTSLSTMMEQVYAQFDALAAAYPSYVSKVDALEYTATIMQEKYRVVNYPIYARLGGVATGDYLATPTYKTYMYCLSESKVYAGNSTYCKKRKIFIVGATHGIEIGGSVNTYILAKELCESADPNIMKLRASYDIYIVPCLNGYGIYHQTRQNADGIDINRNYPVPNWRPIFEPGDPQYSGETAGSTFESQIVMSLTEMLKPDIAIDHHNNWAQQAIGILYTEVADERHARICYQSLVDMASTFINELPAYYGTMPRLFMDYDTNAAPYKVGSLADHYGQTFRWFACNGVHVPMTLEICASIPCVNGEAVSTNPNYSNDAMSVAEYTLTNQLFHFCEWDMNNTKRKLQGIAHNP